MKAIPLIIPRVFPPAVTDAFMRRAPLCPAALEGLCIRVNPGPQRNRRLDEGLEGPVWDMCQPPHHDRATTREHPEDRRLLCRKGAPAALPPQASAPAMPPFFTTASGLPLGPAPMETSSHATSSVSGGEGRLGTMPGRH
jgi:hypothetical protein